ncbi:MAG: pyruvate kinase [Proteobacteria bacterium]|nr:pyruvate kinase [Desulfocapsa sp.]MBU3946248.1 pyruvate kinase [Pseudomonadota bacterium]MCG2742460.1 pyruvate kinase [Desulfobacteraceae bacterium]MBU3983283.1 pyruvate kinase [Pseudomonadota bacterium]MBU4044403.1 pyruvate kinase [Pseudomonadota bacterium]
MNTRKTKIVCTIGPATSAFTILKQLAENGMNVARLNMSHGTHKWHSEVIKHIKTINEKTGSSVAILLDTKGPEVRTGDVKTDIVLHKGETLTLTIRRQAELEPYCVEINYDGFVSDVALGDIVLIDGGMLSLKVMDITQTDIRCECLDNGVLSSRRHVNIRGKSADLPSITEKDWQDIALGIENGVDFIALSFVKGAPAIEELQQFITEKNVPIDIIAKIESAEAIPHLDEIIAVSDGIMIARGDLGAELPYEEVPLLQEQIIKKCRIAGKPVIVATHMLESMIVNPTPTRAEVTDITQAVLQGTDAIMLSGETATGKHPLKALEVMDVVARRIEREMEQDTKVMVQASDNAKYEIARSASILNNNLKAAATLVFTRRGLMAVLLSQCRPNGPIYAFTNTTHVRRRLGIHWGVSAFRIKFSNDPEVSIDRAVTQLQHKKLLKEGDRMIVLSDILAGGKFIETVQVRIV